MGDQGATEGQGYKETAKYYPKGIPTDKDAQSFVVTVNDVPCLPKWQGYELVAQGPITLAVRRFLDGQFLMPS